MGNCHPDVKGSYACLDTETGEDQEKDKVVSNRMDCVGHLTKQTHIESYRIMGKSKYQQCCENEDTAYMVGDQVGLDGLLMLRTIRLLIVLVKHKSGKREGYTF